MNIKAAALSLAMILSFIAMPRLSQAQEDVSQLATTSIPQSYKLSELPNDYKCFSIVTTSNDGGLLAVMGVSMRAGGGMGMSEFFLLQQMDGMFWSKGTRVQFGNQRYLVGYRVGLNMKSYPWGQGATADSVLVLKLRLIDENSIKEFGYNSEFTPDDLRKLVRSLDGNDGQESMGTMPSEAASDAPGLEPAEMASSRTQDMMSLKQIALATIMYSADNDDNMPRGNSTSQVQELIMPYLKSNSVFNVANENGGRFLYNVRLSTKTALDIEAPAECPMWWSSKPYPDGKMLVAFTDGHVAAMSQEAFRMMAERFKLKF